MTFLLYYFTSGKYSKREFFFIYYYKEIMVNKLLHGTRLWYQTAHNASTGKYFLEYVLDATSSDLAAFYAVTKDRTSPPVLLSSCGRFQMPPKLGAESESLVFLIDSGEVLICNQPGGEFFADIFLDDRFKSAASLSLGNDRILFLNSLRENHYGMNQLSFLDSLSKIAQEIPEEEY